MIRINDKSITIRRGIGEEKFIEGYAAKWNSDSLLLNEGGKRFIERISPYAFTPALNALESSAFDCIASYNHDRGMPLARSKSGTLTLSQDEIGLFFSFRSPSSSLGMDLEAMIERGDLSACSFIAVYNPTSVQEERVDGTLYRTINEFSQIRDVSIVVDAAYPATELAQITRSITEFEEKEAAALESHRKAVEEQTSNIDRLLNQFKKQ